MKKGIKTLISGIGILLIGGIAVPLSIIMPLISEASDSEEQFLIPGTHEAQVEKEGRYYLWNNHRTIYEGKSYNRAEEVPDGLDFKFTDSKGVELDFFTDTSTSVSVGSSSKKSIGYVKVNGSDTLTISVSGDVEPHVFSFSESSFFKMFGLIMGVVLLAFLAATCGIGLIVWGIVKLTNNPAKGGNNIPPAMPST